MPHSPASDRPFPISELAHIYPYRITETRSRVASAQGGAHVLHMRVRTKAMKFRNRGAQNVLLGATFTGGAAEMKNRRRPP
jgi:hypothetical protein